MSTDINRIAELDKEDPKRQFYSIAHLITGEKLHEAFRSLRKDASALRKRSHGGNEIPTRNRKSGLGNPPPTAGASEFYPNHLPVRSHTGLPIVQQKTKGFII